MNREIKFRAFDKIRKELFYLPVQSGENKNWLQIDKTSFSVSNNNQFVEKFDLMQYTGFKDFNGKEIYEGDILEYVSFRREESKRIEIVEFDIKCGGWYVHKSADTLADVLFCQHNNEWKLKQGFTINENQRVRIIGNIFENSELLQTT